MEREANSDLTLFGKTTDTTQLSTPILTGTIALTSQSKNPEISSEAQWDREKLRKENTTN